MMMIVSNHRPECTWNGKISGQIVRPISLLAISINSSSAIRSNVSITNMRYRRLNSLVYVHAQYWRQYRRIDRSIWARGVGNKLTFLRRPMKFKFVYVACQWSFLSSSGSCPTLFFETLCSFIFFVFREPIELHSHIFLMVREAIYFINNARSTTIVATLTIHIKSIIFHQWEREGDRETLSELASTFYILYLIFQLLEFWTWMQIKYLIDSMPKQTKVRTRAKRTG